MMHSRKVNSALKKMKYRYQVVDIHVMSSGADCSRNRDVPPVRKHMSDRPIFLKPYDTREGCFTS